MPKRRQIWQEQILAMTKSRSDKCTMREGSPDRTRSVKSPPKSGSVRSSVVERAVRKVANRRDDSGQFRSSDAHKSKH